DESFRLGNGRDGSDFISIPLATLVSNELDVGFSLLLSPFDWPMDIWLLLQGSSRAFTFRRVHYRIDRHHTVLARMHLYGHAADVRASLAGAVALFAPFFEPANTEVFVSCAGTGSYSWYEGPLDQGHLD